MDIRVTRGKSDDIIDRIIAVLRTYGKDHPRARSISIAKTVFP